MKSLPVLGKMFKITELLAKITRELTGTQKTLVKMQNKTAGSVNVAILGAMGSVAAVITALAAATVVPEPASKEALNSICDCCGRTRHSCHRKNI